MFVPSNTGNFRFELPKDFVPKNISESFMPLIAKMNSPFDNANEYISSTIKNIALPSLSQNVVSQNRRAPGLASPPIEFNYRGVQNPNSLFENKEFSISFIASDGWLNYFILMNLFFHYYNFGKKSHHAPDFRVRVLDTNGIETMHIIFRQVIFTAMEGITFNYGDTNENYAEFSANFKYAILDLEYEGVAKSALNQGIIIEDKK